MPLVLPIALLTAAMVWKQPLPATPFHIGKFALIVPVYLIYGWNVLTTAAPNLLRGQVADETFLMTIATLGTMAIYQLPKAVAVISSTESVSCSRITRWVAHVVPLP